MILSKWDNLTHTREDLHRKFHGTYVHAVAPELDKNPRVYYVHEVGSEGATVQVHGGPLHTVSVSKFDILAAWPRLTGAHNLGDKTIIFVLREPARQWQVGFTRHNARILNAAGESIAIGGINFPNAEAAFNDTYEEVSVKELVSRFDKDKQLIARAINNTYWLRRSGSDVVLYRRQVPLGNFSYGSFFINKACRDFSQELVDDLKIRTARTNG